MNKLISKESATKYLVMIFIINSFLYNDEHKNKIVGAVLKYFLSVKSLNFKMS